MSVAPLPHDPEILLLREENRAALEHLLDQERWGSLYLRSLLHEFGVSPTTHAEHGRFLGARRGEDLTAVLFSGNSRNLCSLGDVSDLAPLLERSFLGSPPPRLFVGPAEHARSVREAFARHGALPLLDREQLYYVLTRDTLVPLDSLAIRPARADETEWVTTAQAAMTEEDLCVARSHIDMNRLRDISARRIAAGKVWVVAEGSTLLFKAEESARTEDGLLIGGVFTLPAHRGRGLAARGIAAWARLLFQDGLAVIALHVNRDNLPAIRAYERVGFRRHSALRLMLTY